MASSSSRRRISRRSCTSHILGSDGVADVCPMCSGRVLDKASLRHFLLGMDEYEKTHPGYRDFVMWQRGKSFASPHLAACAYFNETGKEVKL
jgi:hypothetical protein